MKWSHSLKNSKNPSKFYNDAEWAISHYRITVNHQQGTFTPVVFFLSVNVPLMLTCLRGNASSQSSHFLNWPAHFRGPLFPKIFRSMTFFSSFIKKLPCFCEKCLHEFKAFPSLTCLQILATLHVRGSNSPFWSVIFSSQGIKLRDKWVALLYISLYCRSLDQEAAFSLVLPCDLSIRTIIFTTN